MTHGPTRRRLATWLLLWLTMLPSSAWAGSAATDDDLEVFRTVAFQPQLPAGSKWRHPVSGTRVDLVLKPGPISRARVWLDGLPVSQHSEVRRHGPLPDAPGNPGQSLLTGVSADNPLLTEQWSLTLTEVSPARDWFAFHVAGTVTGPDGAGRSDQPFASRSGRVRIAPTNWVELTQLAQLDFLAPGHSFSWEVRERFQEFITNAPTGTVVTVADDLRCGLHILELEPLDGDEIPVSEVRMLATAGIPDCSSSPRPYWIRQFLTRCVAYLNPANPKTILETPVRGCSWANPQFSLPSLVGPTGSSFWSVEGSLPIASLQIPYYANYSLSNGWSVLFFRADGPGGSPSELLFSAKGDIRPHGDMIDLTFPSDSAPVMPDELFYTVEFMGNGNGKVAGLIFTEALPLAGNGESEYWTLWSGTWVSFLPL